MVSTFQFGAGPFLWEQSSMEDSFRVIPNEISMLDPA